MTKKHGIFPGGVQDASNGEPMTTLAGPTSYAELEALARDADPPTREFEVPTLDVELEEM